MIAGWKIRCQLQRGGFLIIYKRRVLRFAQEDSISDY